MTEDEAKTKFCPVAVASSIQRYSDATLEGDLAPSNRIYDEISKKTIPAPGCKCIGSKCMAWRWERTPNSAIKRKDGFCGLAGRP